MRLSAGPAVFVVTSPKRVILVQMPKGRARPRAALREGRFGDALALYTAALQGQPVEPRLLLNCSLAALRLGARRRHLHNQVKRIA